MARRFRPTQDAGVGGGLGRAPAASNRFEYLRGVGTEKARLVRALSDKDDEDCDPASFKRHSGEQYHVRAFRDDESGGKQAV